MKRFTTGQKLSFVILSTIAGVIIVAAMGGCVWNDYEAQANEARKEAARLMNEAREFAVQNAGLLARITLYEERDPFDERIGEAVATIAANDAERRAREDAAAEKNAEADEADEAAETAKSEAWGLAEVAAMGLSAIIPGGPLLVGLMRSMKNGAKLSKALTTTIGAIEINKNADGTPNWSAVGEAQDRDGSRELIRAIRKPFKALPVIPAATSMSV